MDDEAGAQNLQLVNMKQNKQDESNFAKRKAAEAIRRDREAKLLEIKSAARKKRLEIVFSMSDEVVVVEKWYKPQIDALNKKASELGLVWPKGPLGDRYSRILREEWLELHHEKRKRLSVIEEKYISNLKANEDWYEAESERVEKESQELLDGLKDTIDN